MTDEKLPARDRILKTASELMEVQGYHATGLNQIIRESQTPKGSLYHYFPDGKEELAIEAIETKSRFMQHKTQQTLDAVDDPAEAVRAVLMNMVYHMRQVQCKGGTPLAAVALETANTNDRLREACAVAYDGLRTIFKQKFLDHNFAEDQAERLATTVIAAIDGAIIQARTHIDPSRLEQVAESLFLLIRAESP